MGLLSRAGAIGRGAMRGLNSYEGLLGGALLGVGGLSAAAQLSEDGRVQQIAARIKEMNPQMPDEAVTMMAKKFLEREIQGGDQVLPPQDAPRQYGPWKYPE